jgi:hypothetical protein
MILLKATTETLQITTSTTGALDFSVSYADITTLSFAPSTLEGKIVTATTTTITAAPGATTERQIKLITISNKDASLSNNVVIQKNISATTYNLTPTITLLAGEMLQYMDGVGWNYYSTTGALKGNQTAAGSTNQLQFNNGGVLTGDSDFTWNNTTNELAFNGTDTGILMNSITNEPATPAANYGRFYTKSVAGRVIPKFVGPTGYDYEIQAGLGGNNVRVWRGGATTVSTTFASTIGSMIYTSLSPTAPTIPTQTTTSILNQTYRSTISTGATAGALAYIRGNNLIFCRGNAASIGGFTVSHRFALSGTLQSGMRAFIGIVDVAANPTNIDPTTTTAPGGVGLAINTNSGDWNIVNNITGTARTSTSLGASFPVNNTDLMEILIFAPTDGSVINYRVTNLTTAATISGSLSTNIPANTTFMTPSVWITNQATAAAQTLDYVSTYVETDF